MYELPVGSAVRATLKAGLGNGGLWWSEADALTNEVVIPTSGALRCSEQPASIVDSIQIRIPGREP